MKIRYKTFKTREGTFLEVYGSSLDIMKVDALAKKKGIYAGDYLYNNSGDVIGRQYYKYERSPYGGLTSVYPDDFVSNLPIKIAKVVSKELEMLNKIEEKKPGAIKKSLGSRTVRKIIEKLYNISELEKIEDLNKSLNPLKINPKDYRIALYNSSNLYVKISSYKRDFEETWIGFLESNFSKYTNIKYLSDVIKKKFGLEIRAFYDKVLYVQRDIFKKKNFLFVLVAIRDTEETLLKIEDQFKSHLSKEKVEKRNQDMKFYEKSLKDWELETPYNEQRYSKEVQLAKNKLISSIEDYLNKKCMGVTLSKIAEQKRDHLLQKFQTY